MSDLDFELQLSWSGTGREGVGRIDTDDLVLELSAPESMGGRGSARTPKSCSSAPCPRATPQPCLECCDAPDFRCARWR
jgi:hypothetical protein